MPVGGGAGQHVHVHAGAEDVAPLVVRVVAPNGQNVIRVQSEGYPTLEVDLSDLSPRPEEANSSDRKSTRLNSSHRP